MNSGPFLVVLAGGSGTRFWPKSTSRKPKQFLNFGGSGKSLLVQTLERFGDLVPKAQRIIVTTELLSDPVKQEALGVEVLSEPQGRNTAPCIYWAARAVAAQDLKAVMMVMSSDHYIAQNQKFLEIIRFAISRAASYDELVILGVRPTRPETGYGYLRMGEKLDSSGCQRVEAFVEKPNLPRAREFLEAGNYLWNGGMFLWRAEVILEAFDRHMPEMKKAWEASRGDIRLAYPQMTATSIDYGIMEKAKNVVGFPLDCGWDDLGSWTSLEELAASLKARREVGTVMAGETLGVDSQGNIVDVPEKLVALLGVNDLIIVEHGEALLVARKDRAQEIRQIVDLVKKRRPDLV